MASTIFVATRGKTLDYRFLIRGPERQWWLDYRNYTSFERPTLIVERRYGQGRVYLSGIPSARRDRVGTTIRYTLVVEFNDHEARLVPLIYAWLQEVANAPASRPTQSDLTKNYFDPLFSEAYVEELLNLQASDPKFDQLQQDLDQLLSRVDYELTFSSRSDAPAGIWFGGLQNEKSRADWIALVDQILKGTKDGVALVLNLAEGHNLVEIAPDQPPKALLLPEVFEPPTVLIKSSKEGVNGFPLNVRNVPLWMVLIVSSSVLAMILLWIVWKIFAPDPTPVFEVFELSSTWKNSSSFDLTVEASILSQREIVEFQVLGSTLPAGELFIEHSFSLNEFGCQKNGILKCQYSTTISIDSIDLDIEPSTYRVQLTALDQDGNKAEIECDQTWKTSDCCAESKSNL